MKVEIMLILDSEYNSLSLPELEVRDEEEIQAIARRAWTKEQILNGSVEYFIEGHKLPTPIDIIF